MMNTDIDVLLESELLMKNINYIFHNALLPFDK